MVAQGFLFWLENKREKNQRKIYKTLVAKEHHYNDNNDDDDALTFFIILFFYLKIKNL